MLKWEKTKLQGIQSYATTGKEATQNKKQAQPLLKIQELKVNLHLELFGIDDKLQLQ